MNKVIKNTRNIVLVCANARSTSTNIASAAVRNISTCTNPLLYKTGYGTGKPFRVKAELDEETVEYLKENNLKPKQHPGAFHLSKVSIPEFYRDAIQKIFSHERKSEIVENSKELRKYIWSRRLPIEEHRLMEKAEKINEDIRSEYEVMLPFLSAEELKRTEQRVRSRVLNQLYSTTYNWKPINFTRTRGLEYLFGRSPGEFAALSRIFNEIAKRDPEFKPKTLCDFGSGVGTVTWAARTYWASSLFEHLCTDISFEMNDLAELILRGGCKNNDHPIPALFFRQHLPESSKIGYDLVVSAYTLMELPSAKDRLEMIDKLWKKTQTQGYFIVVEPGTRAGFRAVMEARDYILGLDKPEGSYRPRQAFVFSPCPASNTCPRFAFDTIPCNYEIKFRPIYPFHADGCATERYCYVVIKKDFPNPLEERWPRLVQHPMKRSRHVICRMCTKESKIKELFLTRKKHPVDFRVLVKRSRWGDLLPIHLKEEDCIDVKDEGKEFRDSPEE